MSVIHTAANKWMRQARTAVAHEGRGVLLKNGHIHDSVSVIMASSISEHFMSGFELIVASSHLVFSNSHASSLNSAPHNTGARMREATTTPYRTHVWD